MKRKLSLILILLAMMLFSLTSISYASSPTVILDGEELYFDVQPIIENGRTLVPFRGIFEALGADVSWDPSDRSVTAFKSDGTELTLWIGSRTVLLDWDTFTIDEPPKIINGRTLVPLRVVSEALGADVDWDGYSQTVFIKSNSDEYIDVDELILGDTDNDDYDDADDDEYIDEDVAELIFGDTDDNDYDNNYDDTDNDEYDTNVIYDDFSMPLSNNWDLSLVEGDWTIDPGTGARSSSGGYVSSYLPLKYSVTNNYTIECKIGFDTYSREIVRYAGVFIKASEDFSSKTPRICFMTHTYSNEDKNDKYYSENVQTRIGGFEKTQKVNANMVPGEEYTLKVVVNDKNVDVYVDGQYKFSAVVKEQGNLVGLYTHRSSSYAGSYIKDFKITMNN